MPPPEALPDELAEALARIEALVARFEQHPDEAVRDRAADLLRGVDLVHRAGLTRLAALLRAAGLEGAALDDPAIGLLFELYDLAPGQERERADAVLDAVRPYLESHGGRLEVVAAEAGVVAVRLSGACHGCVGSAATLHHVVEQALRDGLPGFARMEVVQPPPKNFIPVASLLAEPVPALRWHAALPAAEVPPGGVRGVVVDREPVLLASLDGLVYAYRDACPDSPFRLEGGRVEDGVLRCPWHGCRFDLRTGRRVGGPGPGLTVVPVAVEDGQVRIGVLAGAAA